jgi:hypothetical protein
MAATATYSCLQTLICEEHFQLQSWSQMRVKSKITRESKELSPEPPPPPPPPPPSFSFLLLCGQTFQCLLTRPSINAGVRLSWQTDGQQNHRQNPGSIVGKLPILPLPFLSGRWRSLIEEYSIATFLCTGAEPATTSSVTTPPPTRLQSSPHYTTESHTDPSLHRTCRRCNPVPQAKFGFSSSVRRRVCAWFSACASSSRVLVLLGARTGARGERRPKWMKTRKHIRPRKQPSALLITTLYCLLLCHYAHTKVVLNFYPLFFFWW